MADFWLFVLACCLGCTLGAIMAAGVLIEAYEKNIVKRVENIFNRNEQLKQHVFDKLEAIFNTNDDFNNVIVKKFNKIYDEKIKITFNEMDTRTKLFTNELNTMSQSWHEIIKTIISNSEKNNGVIISKLINEILKQTIDQLSEKMTILQNKLIVEFYHNKDSEFDKIKQEIMLDVQNKLLNQILKSNIKNYSSTENGYEDNQNVELKASEKNVDALKYKMPPTRFSTSSPAEY